MTADTTTDAVKLKIAKLLALSASPNQHEAELAMAKVQELLQRHRLTMTDINPASAKTRSAIGQGRQTLVNDDKWKRVLHGTIGYAFNCLSLFAPLDAKASRYHLIFIGDDVSRSVAESVYDYMLETAVRAEQHSWAQFDGYKGGNTRNVYRRSYYLGFNSGLGNVARARRAALDAESQTSTALAVRTADAIAEYVKTELTNVKAAKHVKTKAGHTEASIDGYNTGRKQNMNGGLPG